MSLSYALLGVGVIYVPYCATALQFSVRSSPIVCNPTPSSHVSVSTSFYTRVTTSDTFLTSCSVTGVGGFEARVVSDSTGTSVSGETISAVDRLGCDIVGQPAQTQVVYLNKFSLGQGGWLTPIFPSQAEAGGELDFTVIYQGRTYAFTSDVPPVGTNCVTLHVPSGNVTMMNVMNGNCSYCT